MEGRAGGRVESRQEVFAMLLLFSNVIKDGTHVFIVQKRPTAQKFARFMPWDSKRAKSLPVRPSNWPNFGQLRWDIASLKGHSVHMALSLIKGARNLLRDSHNALSLIHI